jgi:hypothetical protein
VADTRKVSDTYVDTAMAVLGTVVAAARRVSVVMTYATRRSFAEFWWLKGFASSGKGFHGESYDTARHPALTALLVSEFERAWAERQR